MTFLPCPGGCGHKVNGFPVVLHCSSCIALVKAQVERHAALWAPIIAASLAMNGGRMPEIDPSLLRSAT